MQYLHIWPFVALQQLWTSVTIFLIPISGTCCFQLILMITTSDTAQFLVPPLEPYVTRHSFCTSCDHELESQQIKWKFSLSI